MKWKTQESKVRAVDEFNDKLDSAEISDQEIRGKTARMKQEKKKKEGNTEYTIGNRVK